nr:hypothetical protein Iba_chr14fCG7900 [Ipomoea batatas]
MAVDAVPPATAPDGWSRDRQHEQIPPSPFGEPGVRATKVVAVGVRSRRACDGVLLPVATQRSRAGGAGRRSFLFRLPPPLGNDGTRRRHSRLRAASPFQQAKPSDLPSLGRRRWHESSAMQQ